MIKNRKTAASQPVTATQILKDGGVPPTDLAYAIATAADYHNAHVLPNIGAGDEFIEKDRVKNLEEAQSFVNDYNAPAEKNEPKFPQKLIANTWLNDEQSAVRQDIIRARSRISPVPTVRAVPCAASTWTQEGPWADKAKVAPQPASTGRKL